MQTSQDLSLSKDVILLNGMEFMGQHGCSEEERKHLQPFIVDAELYLDLSKSGKSDSLADTVDYVQVFNIVKQIVTSTSRNLIEAVAEDISQSLLKQFIQIETLKITIHKPAAPIADTFNGAAISIVRSRNPN